MAGGYIGTAPADRDPTVGNEAITTAKLADDAVTAAKLANAINTDIDANTTKVTNATHTGDVTGATALTIADNAVTLAKMAGLARGKIIVGDSSGDPSALTLGATNKVLKSDGSDAVWGDDAGGGMVLVDSGELTSDVTEWQSLNTMSSTYRNYFLVFNSIAPDSSSSSGNHIYIRFGDATISANNNHQWVMRYLMSDSNGGTEQSTGDSDGIRLGRHVQSEPFADAASNGISGRIWINNPASSSYNTTFTFMAQYFGLDEAFGTDRSTNSYGGGQVTSKLADVSFEFHSHTGGLEGTDITSYFRLYGLKDS